MFAQLGRARFEYRSCADYSNGKELATAIVDRDLLCTIKKQNMNKLIVPALCLLLIGSACNDSNNNPGESGAINDGMAPVDENGGLQDTGYQYTPATDSAKAEDRVDVQPRN